MHNEGKLAAKDGPVIATRAGMNVEWVVMKGSKYAGAEEVKGGKIIREMKWECWIYGTRKVVRIE